MKNDRESEDLAFDYCKKAMLERLTEQRTIKSKSFTEAFSVTQDEYNEITNSLKPLLNELLHSETYSNTYYLLLENSNSLTGFVIKIILFNELQNKISEEKDPLNQIIKLLMK